MVMVAGCRVAVVAGAAIGQKEKKKAKKNLTLFSYLYRVWWVQTRWATSLVVVVAGRACGGGCRWSSFRQGVVVAGTWRARDVMCDGYVTPEGQGICSVGVRTERDVDFGWSEKNVT
jgi:hypothetical protein